MTFLQRIVRRICTSQVLSKNEFQVTDTKFVMKLNSESAYVTYSKVGNVYDLDEIFVPERYRNGPTAKVLAAKVFDHIVSSKGKIKISCPYLSNFYKNNKRKYQNNITS